MHKATQASLFATTVPSAVVLPAKASKEKRRNLGFIVEVDYNGL
jgi:hypothetical protein